MHLQTKHRGSRNGSHHSLDSRAYSTEDRPLSRPWLSDLWTEGIISPRGMHCLSVFLEMPDNEPSEQQQTQQMATNGIFPVFIGRHMSSGNIMRKLSAAPVGSFMGFCLFLNFYIYCVSQACDGPAGDHPGPAPPFFSPFGSLLCKMYLAPIFLISFEDLSPALFKNNSATTNLGSCDVRCFWFKITAPRNRVSKPPT